MQDYQIGQKFMGLAPADMASRRHHLINRKKVFISKQPSPPAGTTPTLILPCFTLFSFDYTFAFHLVVIFLWFLMTSHLFGTHKNNSPKIFPSWLSELVPSWGYFLASSAARTRVARWFVFKPKIPISVNFGGSCFGKYWYIL
jgi:hypothetical protein